MNISALQKNSCMRFGSTDFNDETYNESLQNVVGLTEQLKDTWCKVDDNNANEKDIKKKSKLRTALSVGGAVAVTFVGGKLIADKLMQAFPSLPTKLKGGIKKGAAFIKEKSAELSTKENKLINTFGKGLGKVENFARKTYTKIANGKPFEQVLSSAVGVASLATVGPDVIAAKQDHEKVSNLARQRVDDCTKTIRTISIVDNLFDE